MKNTKYTVCFVILLVFVPLSCDAQYWDTKKSSRLFTGGSVGLLFGTVTNIEISPMVGVNVLPRLNTGVSFVYSYINDKRFNVNNETTIYGGRAFSEFVVLKDLEKYIPVKLFKTIYVRTEYEILQLQAEYYNGLTNSEIEGNLWLESFHIGPGIGLPLGGNNTLKLAFLSSPFQQGFYPFNYPLIRFDISIYLNLPSRYKYKSDGF